MKTKLLLSALVLFSFIIISQSVFADGLVSVKKIENVNGSIGITVHNDLSTTLYTNPSTHNSSVFKYYLDNSSVSIIKNGSVTSIGSGKDGFVILNASWPQSKYKLLNVTFIDEGGTLYPSETSYPIFAKQGLSPIEVSVTPQIITTDKSVNISIKIKATGESDISSINVHTKNPSYYALKLKSNPTSMAKGSIEKFVFTYEPTGGTLPETVISNTSYALINVTYEYYGFKTTLNLNESFIVFNKNLIDDKLPNVTVWTQKPIEVEKGKSTNISVYAQNLNIGGHDACDLNFTLTSPNSNIKIPIYDILPGDKLVGSLIRPTSPIVTFKVVSSNSSNIAKYNLTLTTKYKDCEWGSSFKLINDVPISIVKQITINKNVTENNNTNLTNAQNVTPNNSSEISKQASQTTNGPSSSPHTSSNFRFYLILGISGFLIMLSIIGILEWRSRFI